MDSRYISEGYDKCCHEGYCLFRLFNFLPLPVPPSVVVTCMRASSRASAGGRRQCARELPELGCIFSRLVCTMASSEIKPPHRVAPLGDGAKVTTTGTGKSEEIRGTTDPSEGLAVTAPAPAPPRKLPSLAAEMEKKKPTRNVLADIMAECVAETTGEVAPAVAPTSGVAPAPDEVHVALNEDTVASPVSEKGGAPPVRVMGSIDGGDDEESSEASVSDSDSEEEIEVDESAAAAAVAARGKIQPPPVSTGFSLSTRERTQPNKEERVEDTMQDTAGEEFFGIKYQPKARKESGSAFENQTHWSREYEQEIGRNSDILKATEHSVQSPKGRNDGVVEEDDDEFAFDAGDDALPTVTPMQRKIPTDEERKKQFEQESVAMMASLKASIAAEQEEVEASQRNTEAEAAEAGDDEDTPSREDEVGLKAYANAARKLSQAYSGAEDRPEPAAGEVSMPPATPAAPITELRLSIHEHMGKPLEVFDEEEEEEEEECDEDDLGGSVLAMKHVSISTPTSVEPEPTAAPNKEAIVDVDPEEAVRRTQEAEFDAIAKIAEAKPVLDANATTAERIASLGANKLLSHNVLMQSLVGGVDEDLEQGRPIVVETKPTYMKKKRGLMKLFSSKPKKMNAALSGDRDTVFLLAKLPVREDKEMHYNALQAIYRRITGADRDVPMRASAWMDIGFQTENPLTDIRGTGMLGLVHMLGFLDAHLPVVHKIHRLSKTDTNSFPFLVSGFNVSRGVLSALRQGALNAWCNKTNDVLQTTQRFYNATFFSFYTKWRQTTYANMLDAISHFNPIFQDVLTSAMRDPEGTHETFQRYLASTAVKGTSGEVGSFTPVNDEGGGTAQS